jgi:hypothetical protein
MIIRSLPAGLQKTFGTQPEGRVETGPDFFICFGRNILKSPDSAKGIQGNARTFPWIPLDFLARNSP